MDRILPKIVLPAVLFSLLRVLQVLIMSEFSDDRGPSPYLQHGVVGFFVGVISAIVSVQAVKSPLKYGALLSLSAFLIAFALQFLAIPSLWKGGINSLIGPAWAGVSFIPIAAATALLMFPIARHWQLDGSTG